MQAKGTMSTKLNSRRESQPRRRMSPSMTAHEKPPLWRGWPPQGDLAAPDMHSTAESPLQDASFQLFRCPIRRYASRTQVDPRATRDHRRRLPSASPPCSPANTTPYHDTADPPTLTFPERAHRDAPYPPINLTQLRHDHEHGRAEGGRERRRGGEEAKSEPRKSDSHVGRFGEEDWYRRMRARQAVS